MAVGYRLADRLIDRIAETSPCVVGIDPAISRMPRSLVDQFASDGQLKLIESYCQIIIEAVASTVPVVKPQAAYFERYGSAGWAVLERVVDSARQNGLLVILDAKRGDIGATSEAYADAYLRPGAPLEADFLTVNPYLGADALEPFFHHCREYDKGVFVLALTSNPGALAIQNRGSDGITLAEQIADLITAEAQATQGTHGFSAIGGVVGATHPDHAAGLRKRLPHSPILVPGFGAQGGTAESVRACFTSEGTGALVSASRSVIYPKSLESADVVSLDDVRDAIQNAAAEFTRSVRDVLAAG